MNDEAVGHAHALFDLLEGENDPRAVLCVRRIWPRPRRMQKYSMRGILHFDDGQLVMGPLCSSADRVDVWNTKLLLEVAKAIEAIQGASCSASMGWLLSLALDKLRWQCTITCTVCFLTGICAPQACPGCTFDLTECGKRGKFVWPELVGRPAWLARMILGAFHPDKKIVLTTWDVAYGAPGNPDTIRIVHDPRTGFVTTPPPSITSAPDIATSTDNCFLSTDGICVGGAPPNPPPPDWEQYRGQPFAGVVQQLRQRYPRAVVITMPSDRLRSADYRHDRIVVRYDRATGAASDLFVG